MSKTNYKRLGDYIREVDVRNRDLKVTKLVGLTINKAFIPSVANTIGTDLSNYKVIRKEQFACSLMQVSRDEKIPVAMFEGECAIMSPAYPMFEVVDKKILLPQYLMMWFSRNEFDREASFYAIGGVRGSLTWNDFCDFKIPIPPIDQQRKIVAEYNAIQQRIKLNEQLIVKLEETAQAIYRKMFVDGIDKNNLPEGWRMGSLTDIAIYLNGIACQKYTTNKNPYLPVLKIKELSQGYCDNNSSIVDTNIPKEYIINYGDVIFSWSATLFIDIWCGDKCALNQHLFKITSNIYPKWFYFLWTKSHIEEWKRIVSAKATSMGHIKREDLENAKVIIPNKKVFGKLNSIFNPIIDSFCIIKKENLKLNKIQSLLLTNMEG